MKFQSADEEETKEINDYQSPTRSNQEQLNQMNPKYIYVNPSIYLMYCLLNGFSILLGCLFKLIYPITRESIGKKSLLTGIPIIRNNYFVGPFFLNVIYFIWCIYAFYKNSSISVRYKNSLLIYLKNIRGAFVFTNILLLLIFYIFYYYIAIPTKEYGFKLSGHTIASILSGGMIVNLHNTYEPFNSLKLKNFDASFNKYIFMINMFLYYHSIYTIFWSSWIFHHVSELVIAYIISVSSVVIIHCANVDELLLDLIDIFNQRKNPVILYKQSG